MLQYMKNLKNAFSAQFAAPDTIPYPRFILRASDFKIFDLTTHADTLREVKEQGFGIISYTWGRFQNKEVFESSDLRPKFDNSVDRQLQWLIPSVTRQPNGEGFTIDQVRGVIQNINMRYVWWDHACIPQAWAKKDGTLFEPKNPDYKTIQAEEIAKQLFIYTRAKKGVIWLHSTVWTNVQAERGNLQKLFEITKDDKFLWQDYIQCLQQVKETEPWFSSMWTFQEGILLNCDHVVDPSDGTTLRTREHNFFAELRDKNGALLTKDSFFRGSASMLDITGQVTLHQCDLAMKIIDAQKAGLLDKVEEFSNYMIQLEETGFVSFTAGSPLATLEAGKARGVPGPWLRAEDYCVNAVLGALQVTLPASALKKSLDEQKGAFMAALVDRYGWKMILLTKPTYGKLSPQGVKAGQGDWLAILSLEWNFSHLGAYISTTLGATTPEDDSGFTGWMTKFIGLSKTGLLMGGTPRQRLNLPNLIYSAKANPDPKNNALIMTPKQQSFNEPYRIYPYGPNFSAFKSGHWETGRFYASVSGNANSRKKSRCQVKPVLYGDAAQIFGKENFALLPLEDVSFLGLDDPKTPTPAPAPVYTRCVIVGDFTKGTGKDSGSAAGVFIGIGDFDFPSGAVDVAVEDVLDKKTDWAIYLY